MNERIEELWTQGTFNVVPRNGDYSSVSAEQIEKFAELIAQDCISQIALIGVSNFENDDVMWAVGLAIENIEERYGIKK